MLSGKFMKFETTTTEKKAHKNHLSRSQVVGRFVQNSEINLTTTIRCLIRHWKTGCLQLTWQYFDRKFLDSREMVFVFSGKTWGGGGCFSFGGTVQYIEESNIYLCFVVCRLKRGLVT